MSQRHTIEYAQNLASVKHGKCLSTKYTNNHTHMKWCCKNGHIWGATLCKISIGQWCPYCSKKAKLDIEEAKDIAKSKNGKCLSTEYFNLRSKLTWECFFGHTWGATLGNVKHHGRWCPECCNKNRIKYSIDIIQNLAKERNGVCLSNKYVSYGSDLEWKCENDHIWRAPLSRIKSGGTWCPYCKNKTQNKVSKIIQGIFSNCTVHNNYNKFNWLRNGKTGRNLELDIFVHSPDMSFTLAIEYDGEQHYRPVKFGGCSDDMANEIFRKTVERDNIKNAKMLDNQDKVNYFLRISYLDTISKECVLKKLQTSGVRI